MSRPAVIDVVAALLVFGGLFGATQLVVGDFVITGSLPARGPILGVGAFLHVASVALGILIRTGRGWLPAVSLTLLFAIAYLVALSNTVAAGFGLAHLAAAVALLRTRRWFAAMASARAATRSSGPAPSPQSETRSPKRGGTRRPSGSR